MYTLARQVCYLEHYWQGQLWLVDYTLKPIDGISYDDLVDGCKVFIAKGRRYIEVQLPLSNTRWRRLVEGEASSQTSLDFNIEFEFYMELAKPYCTQNRGYRFDIVACLHDGWLES